MGRVKKKKVTKSKGYSISDVHDALDAIKKGTSICAASKTFHVPYATLHSKARGFCPIDTKPGPSSVLSQDEEKDLVYWIFNLDKMGFLVSKNQLFDSVQMFVKETNRNTPFIKGRPSKHWFQAFITRNPEVSEKICLNPTKTKVKVTKRSIQKWYAKIDNYLESKNLHEIPPSSIFNLEESGFFLAPKSIAIVFKDEKAEFSDNNSKKENCTALIGGNAAGQLIPPMVVYNYENVPIQISEHFPSDFILGISETGWMTGELFYSYIVNHFYNWCKDNNIQFPIIIYIDGHSSHLTKALSDFCCDHEIELIPLHPNATHIMQPTEIALFDALKTSYRNAIQNWQMENDGQSLNQIFFPMVLKTALYSLDLKEILTSGFKKCGLYPFSAEAVTVDNGIDDKNSQCQSSFEEIIDFIESNIGQEILEKFKNNQSDEWTGAIEYKELFNFWLNCKGSNKQVLQNTGKDAIIEVEQINESQDVSFLLEDLLDEQQIEIEFCDRREPLKCKNL